MQNIWIMDEAIPIPENVKSLPNYTDVIKSNTPADFSASIVQWTETEFKRIFAYKDIQTEYDFTNLRFIFFKSQFYGEPEASFSYQTGAIYVGCDETDTGKESDIQQAIIHESTHATTLDIKEVGTAITEGIALYMERKWAEYHNIGFEEKDRPSNYLWAFRLVECIIKNIYDNNLSLFFEMIKKGNESLFIQAVDNFLKSHNSKYSARNLIRLSSVLFYAQSMPDSPFKDVQQPQHIESLREEVSSCFCGVIPNKSSKINDLLESAKKIELIRNVARNRLDNCQFGKFSICLDRSLASILLDESQLLTDLNIASSVNKTMKDIEYVSHQTIGERPLEEIKL